MSKKNYEQAKAKWQEHGCDIKILYQWVKNDMIDCKVFEQLVEYKPQYEKQQIMYDTFD